MKKNKKTALVYKTTPDQKYRLACISKLNLKKRDIFNVPLKYGIALEKIDVTYSSYYVIAFINYNRKEEEAELKSVGNRLLDVDYTDWDVVKELINEGIQLVNDANRYDDDDLFDFDEESLDN